MKRRGFLAMLGSAAASVGALLGVCVASSDERDAEPVNEPQIPHDKESWPESYPSMSAGTMTHCIGRTDVLDDAGEYVIAAFNKCTLTLYYDGRRKEPTGWHVELTHPLLVRGAFVSAVFKGGAVLVKPEGDPDMLVVGRGMVSVISRGCRETIEVTSIPRESHQ